MTSPYNMFSTDKELETGKGVTIDYGAFKFVIHRAGGANRTYQTALAAKSAPYRRQMSAGTLSDDISTKIMAEVYADTIIKGWDGITDAKGKKIPFTRENVIKLLTDLPELFNAISDEANRLANFRKEELEAEEKNSVKS